MKIKPSTLGLLMAALAMGGIVLLVQQQPAPKSTEAGSDTGQPVTEEANPLFSFKEADIQAITLQTQLRKLKFERDKADKWQMLEPEKTTASDPSLAFLLDLVTTGTTSRSIPVPASDREQFGLHQPMATIDLTLKDKQTHKLVIGSYDFNRTHLYAQADPPAAADPLKVLLVSPNFDQAVNRPVAEWKQPATAEKSSSPAAAAPGAVVPGVPSSDSPDSKGAAEPSPALPSQPARPESPSSESPSASPAQPDKSEAKPETSPDSKNPDSKNSDQ